jgi:magnesium chelatase family protein
MLAKVKSMSFVGIDGQLVSIQVDVSNGLPSWDVVGLPDTSIKESKQRVRAALSNIGYDLPSRRVIVNLAPANIKKEGSFFDLPIALRLIM